ncbi:MAG TPA: hypothetical protein VMW45_04195 [Dehalococcoidia bacterium]|nr:hypothetical protein [Dehalococcoidia bacterium]
MKKESRRDQVLRSELSQFCEDALGVPSWGGLQVSQVKRDNNPLPTWAYLQGYSFVEFIVNRADPYALIAPDGLVIQVWEKPPSLTELSEAIEGKVR